MAYHIFFGFTNGIKTTIKVPIGTIERIRSRVTEIEKALNVVRDDKGEWRRSKYKEIKDKDFCKAVERHNDFIRWLYERLEHWSENPPEIFEELTPEQFKKFLPALQIINIPTERWTGDYYTERMKACYEVMRGNEEEGMTWDVEPLSTEQAAAVIILFSQYLDKEDRRLDVPNGRDYLASSYDGGYEWCEKCGAVAPDDIWKCDKEGCELNSDEEE